MHRHGVSHPYSAENLYWERLLMISLFWFSFAKAEIYLTIATIFSRYTNMQLYDTNYERDVKVVSDMFLPQASKNSRGVRVLFG